MSLCLLVSCTEVPRDEGPAPELGSFAIELGESSVRSLTQVIVGTGPNRAQLTITNAGSGLAGCGEVGVFCADATITSGYAAHELRGLTLSLDQLTPVGTVAANGDERPDYLPAKVRDDLGLWVYGDLGPGESLTREWRFQWAGGRIYLTGKLFADVVPVGDPVETSCTNAADDDGDKKIDCADADCIGDEGCGGDPTPTQNLLSTWGQHSCAVIFGNVRCWGANGNGQLGYGHTSAIGDNETPATAGNVDVGGTVTQLATGQAHTCALLDGGAVRCWGWGLSGQLGYASTADIGDNELPSSAGDVQVGGSVTQLSGGGSHTCARLSTGSVRCWGASQSGQLGYANTSTIGDTETPLAAGDVNVGGSVIQVVTGMEHTCALLVGGSVRCWGTAAHGRLGYGNFAFIGDDEHPSAAGNVNIGGTVVQLAAGHAHTCALLGDGNVRCWGDGSDGALGYGNVNNIGDNETPASAGNVNVGGSVAQISAGRDHTCARLMTGAVRCWGLGTGGRLGYGNTTSIGDNETPSSAGDVDVGGSVSGIAAGAAHTCALFGNGDVRCWGTATNGSLGYGNTTSIGDTETPASAGDVPLF